jgi:hypothetical protein
MPISRSAVGFGKWSGRGQQVLAVSLAAEADAAPDLTLSEPGTGPLSTTLKLSSTAGT